MEMLTWVSTHSNPRSSGHAVKPEGHGCPSRRRTLRLRAACFAESSSDAETHTQLVYSPVVGSTSVLGYNCSATVEGPLAARCDPQMEPVGSDRQLPPCCVTCWAQTWAPDAAQ